MKRIQPKQKRFVTEYILCQNAKQAAIRAGYSEKSAETDGPRLLRNAQVRAEIEELYDKVQKKAVVDVSYVLRNLKEVVERCMQRAPVMEFDHEEKCMVQVTDEEGRNVWEFDSTGANKALENLGRHLKMFTDKTEHGFDPKFSDLLDEAIRRGNDASGI